MAAPWSLSDGCPFAACSTSHGTAFSGNFERPDLLLPRKRFRRSAIMIASGLPRRSRCSNQAALRSLNHAAFSADSRPDFFGGSSSWASAKSKKTGPGWAAAAVASATREASWVEREVAWLRGVAAWRAVGLAAL